MSGLFNGLSQANVFNNNPAFSAMLRTSPAPGVLAGLAMDLTGGKNLVELSSAMVLTNILSKLKVGSSSTYAIVKIVGPVLILAGGAYEFAKHLSYIPASLSFVASKVAGCVTASIVVPAESALNADVCGYVVAQNTGKTAKSLTLAPGFMQDFDDLDDEEVDIDVAERSTKPLNYIPSFGQSTFYFKGYRMTLMRKEATVVENDDGKLLKVEPGEADPTKRQNVTITCFPTFRGTEPIKELLNHVRGFSTPFRERVTQIYRPEKGPGGHIYWDACFRPARALDGVVMESTLKNSLVSDIEFYLSPACQKFYENRGIPYRRGYLLYGPPGTGKTSFASSVASHFNLPVYVLNLTDLDDKGLNTLFNMMVKKCVLLLEDVDSAGLNREYDADDEPDDGEGWESLIAGRVGGVSKKSKRRRVTLAGLLNCLDGPASVDGRLLCMTSNSPDNLDAALVRPGRCDRKVLFGYVCPEVSATLFRNIYTRAPNEIYKDEENTADVHDIPALAAHFAEKIPIDAAITPAECQAWLLANRLDPVAAFDGAAEWAKEIVETKLRGANVASFTNEIKTMPGFQMFDTPPTSQAPSMASSEDADLKDFDD